MGQAILRKILLVDDEGAIPVILMSAEALDRTKAEARKIGVGAFLIKPFSNGVLRETVVRLLESAAARSTDPQVA